MVWDHIKPSSTEYFEILSDFICYTMLWESPAAGLQHTLREGSPHSKTTSGQEAANQGAPALDLCNIMQQISSHSLGKEKGINAGKAMPFQFVVNTVSSFLCSLSSVNDKGKGSWWGIGFFGVSLAAARVSKHWEERQQWALSFQHCLIFRVNNKHWNSKVFLGLVVVSGGKPITLQLQSSFRLPHLLNWVQGAGWTKRCVLLLLHSGAFLRVLQQRGRMEKNHFPPNTSLHLWVTSDRTERATGTGGDLRWVCLVAAGWKHERLPLINVCPRSLMRLERQ